MAANTVGTSTTIFGITDETYGFFESLETSSGVDVAEVLNSVGDIKALAFFSERHNVTGTFVHLTTSPLDANDPRKQIGTGTAITITDANSKLPNYSRTTVYVTEATESMSNTDFMRVSFTGRMDANLG